MIVCNVCRQVIDEENGTRFGVQLMVARCRFSEFTGERPKPEMLGDGDLCPGCVERVRSALAQAVREAFNPPQPAKAMLL